MFCRSMKHRVLLSDGGRDEEKGAEAVVRGAASALLVPRQELTHGAVWPGRSMLKALAPQAGASDPGVFGVSVGKTHLLCGRLPASLC